MHRTYLSSARKNPRYSNAMLGARSDIKIRKAKSADATFVADTFRQSWQQAYRGIIPHLHLENMVRRRGADWWMNTIRSVEGLLVIEHSGTPRRIRDSRFGARADRSRARSTSSTSRPSIRAWGWESISSKPAGTASTSVVSRASSSGRWLRTPWRRIFIGGAAAGRSKQSFETIGGAKLEEDRVCLDLSRRPGLAQAPQAKNRRDQSGLRPVAPRIVGFGGHFFARAAEHLLPREPEPSHRDWRVHRHKPRGTPRRPRPA